MISVLILQFFLFTGHAHAQAPSASPQPAEDSNYEIDYEEVSDGETEEPRPAKARSKPPSSGPAVQGTHSTNKIASLLKSESKSVYKKNGKQLDVDTD